MFQFVLVPDGKIWISSGIQQPRKNWPVCCEGRYHERGHELGPDVDEMLQVFASGLKVVQDDVHVLTLRLEDGRR